MNAYRPALAWLLLTLLLLNGIACGMGHGQPVAATTPVAQLDCGPHATHGGEPAGTTHPALFQLAGDCVFANSLPLALLALTVLGWLSRMRRDVVGQRAPAFLLAPLRAFPRLNPQAP
ncbi:hypothetical protein [Pseudomonas sp. LRF_L74]|uniref:hypothetical protein n=1 Tax=Pseudomonas sp. LRF_L74 TaxID=3369422 RepID=UPI003F6171C6